MLTLKARQQKLFLVLASFILLAGFLTVLLHIQNDSWYDKDEFVKQIVLFAELIPFLITGFLISGFLSIFSEYSSSLPLPCGFQNRPPPFSA